MLGQLPWYFGKFDSFHSLTDWWNWVRPLLNPPPPQQNQGKYYGKVLFAPWFFFFLCFFFPTFLIYTLARGKKLSCLCTAPWGAIRGRLFVKLSICSSAPLWTEWKRTFPRSFWMCLCAPHGLLWRMTQAHSRSGHSVSPQLVWASSRATIHN